MSPENQISPLSWCSWPQEVSSPNWPYLESTQVPIVVTWTMNLKRVGRRGKQQNKDVWLAKIIRWKLFFLICTHIMEILSADADVSPCLWSRFKKKAVFSLHCVQNLIYRSWPWLLFCVTAILENNGRKAWNLRGTECAVFHFFCSYSTENFPSLSKIALFFVSNRSHKLMSKHSMARQQGWV